MWPPAAWFACTCDRIVVPLARVSSVIPPVPCQPMPRSELRTNASVKFCIPDAAEMAARLSATGMAHIDVGTELVLMAHITGDAKRGRVHGDRVCLGGRTCRI